MLDPATFPNPTSLRTRWDEIEQEVKSYVQTCTDESLVQTLAYRNSRDEEHGYPLWQQMVHQVNHATQHRSEVAMILTSWNYSPGAMDFLVFVDQELSIKNH
jgi:uncharacterized damage-inducible protein DinB